MSDTTNVKTAAGAKLYIGGTGTLSEESSWVEIGEIVDFGEYGKNYELITHNPVGSRKPSNSKAPTTKARLRSSWARTPATLARRPC